MVSMVVSFSMFCRSAMEVKLNRTWGTPSPSSAYNLVS